MRDDDANACCKVSIQLMTAMLSVQEIVSSEKTKFSVANKDVMHLCRVVKSISKTTSYELFDLKSGAFLLGCVSDNDSRGDFIFTTLRGTHNRELKEIPTSNFSSSFLGILKRNYLGLVFSLYNDNARIISRIRLVMVLDKKIRG